MRAGLGLLAGLDLSPEVLSAVPDAPMRWKDGCRESGLLVRPIARGIALSPPLVITKQELETLGAAVLNGLAGVDSVAASRQAIL